MKIIKSKDMKGRNAKLLGQHRTAKDIEQAYKKAQMEILEKLARSLKNLAVKDIPVPQVIVEPVKIPEQARVKEILVTVPKRDETGWPKEYRMKVVYE